MGYNITEAFIKSANKETTAIFAQWQQIIKNILKNNQTIAIIPLNKHAKERMQERGITTQKIRHVFNNDFTLYGIQTSTRNDIFKFRIEGPDYNGKILAIGMSVGYTLNMSGYKIFTVFYPDKK